MTLLTEPEIEKRLATLEGWARDGGLIRRTWSFPTYRDGIAFANRAAELAERMDHHPDILIEYRRVTLTLTSHDAGGLTERDFRFAAKIQD